MDSNIPTSESEKALRSLEAAAVAVLERARGTLHGVGLACHVSGYEQQEAFRKAKAKVAAAEALVATVFRFREEHGSFS